MSTFAKLIIALNIAACSTIAETTEITAELTFRLFGCGNEEIIKMEAYMAAQYDMLMHGLNWLPARLGDTPASKKYSVHRSGEEVW